MIIRRTRFDDLDDWLDSVDWGKVKENTGAPLMKLIRIYIRWVGKVSEFVGGVAMYLLLAMMGILLYSIITNAFHRPVIWIMEMSQFTMAAYYILGGASSLKHVSTLEWIFSTSAGSRGRRRWSTCSPYFFCSSTSM